MYEDIIYYGDEAKSKLIAGINKLANAVKVTLGPAGRNVILGDPSGRPVVTKDGVTVAKYIKLIDPIEDMGAQLVKEVSSNTVTAVGDGTTTATVLAQAIINDVGDINNVTEFRKGMEDTRDEILVYLDNKRIPCDKNKDIIHSISKTSANGDNDIADIVSKCAMFVGTEGIIDVVKTDSDSTTFKITEGFKFDRGYSNSNFINSPTTGKSILGDSYVIVINNKVDKFKDIKYLVSAAKDKGLGLVIIAKEFDSEFIDVCSRNFQMGNFVVPVVGPDFGDSAIYTLEDIAIYCDTTVATIEEVANKSKSVRLGLIQGAEISKGHTVLTNNLNMEKVLLRAKQIKGLIKDTENSADITNLKKRISQLSACSASIRVGGATESETKERFDRYEDAVGAAGAAMKGGVLPGGGVALYRASLDWRTRLDIKSDDYVKGRDNLVSALKSPFNQILSNADLDKKLTKGSKFSKGIDAKTGVSVDMIESGIIDPHKVTASALINAVSIASMILTTGCTIESAIIKE